ARPGAGKRRGAARPGDRRPERHAAARPAALSQPQRQGGRTGAAAFRRPELGADPDRTGKRGGRGVVRPLAGFQLKPGPANRRTTAWELNVLRADVDLKVAGRRFGLSAPPGPSVFSWNSLTGPAAGPRKRETVPDWADPKRPAGADGKRMLALLE